MTTGWFSRPFPDAWRRGSASHRWQGHTERLLQGHHHERSPADSGHQACDTQRRQRETPTFGGVYSGFSCLS